LTEHWSETRAERHLRSLELFGMRFGLDRMRRMMTVLGAPQRSFRCVHVVGTNGKSSTTRMVAAILRRHGLRTGAYLSPHLLHYRERVQIDERDLETHEFAGAIARAAHAAERVNRTLAEDDHVTQFELLTAAAFWAMAQRGVEVAVVEAGLGGRYDATSVIESDVTALTNVGLEHTRWLGPTVKDIALEKLAVLRQGTELVLGSGAGPEVVALAREVAAERGAQLWIAPAGTPEVSRLGAPGLFQRANFALAQLAAQRLLAALGTEMRPGAVQQAALATSVPGRAQRIAADPLTVLDGAHNPDAVEALVATLPELVGSRPVALVMGVLDDKDAASMLASLLPHTARAWFTAPASARALSPAALQSLAGQLGFADSECEPRPFAALAAAQAWAKAQGDAAVLATGSVYLVGALLKAIGWEPGEAPRAAAGADAGGADGRLREGNEDVREGRAR
jgi:dihydrofolate synthase/folylpolyglutamate synthase